MLRDAHREGVLHARGISDEIIDAEPMRYRSFEQRDHESFAEFMGFGPKELAKYRGKVTQTGGIVVQRFALNGRKPPAPYARLDRDVPMKGGRKTHYLYWPNDSQKRVDVHPLATLELQSGKPIYLCLEGSLKADAVLSAGGVAISVTSVTTWQGKDLERLLPLLRDAPHVYVVPDSDFFLADQRTRFRDWFNPMVRYQTRLCAQWLQERGVHSEIRIPWLGVDFGAKVGVDDFLRMGYRLRDLNVHPVYFDRLNFQESRWEGVFERATDYTPAQMRVLRELISQGPYGAFLPSIMGRRLGLSRDTVLVAYKRFVERGLMQVWEGKTVLEDAGFRDDPHHFHIYALDDRSYVDYLRATEQPASRRVPPPPATLAMPA